MELRRAKKEDIDGCLNLQKLEGESYWKTEDFENAISDNDVVFLVAEEGKILGYAIGFVVPSKRVEALVHETRVDKAQRGEKIGTKLMDLLCEELFNKDVEVIYAEIEEKLLPFYRDACKFKESGKWIQVEKRK